MEELASRRSEVYTIKRLKQKLLDHYKDVILLLNATMLFVLETWLNIVLMKSGNWKEKIM